MNIIISCLPGEIRLQSVFVPPFLGSTRAMYHANSTEYLFEALTQTYTYNKRHAGRKQRTLQVPWSPDQDRLRCGGIYLGFSLEYNSENKTVSTKRLQIESNKQPAWGAEARCSSAPGCYARTTTVFLR